MTLLPQTTILVQQLKVLFTYQMSWAVNNPQILRTSTSHFWQTSLSTGCRDQALKINLCFETHYWMTQICVASLSNELGNSNVRRQAGSKLIQVTIFMWLQAIWMENICIDGSKDVWLIHNKWIDKVLFWQNMYWGYKSWSQVTWSIAFV